MKMNVNVTTIANNSFARSVSKRGQGCTVRTARRAPAAAMMKQTGGVDGGRREAVGRVALSAGALATFSGLFAPRPAQAGLFGPPPEETYQKDTKYIIDLVEGNLAMDKDDPGRADSVQSVKKATNDWVAKYRRDDRFTGRPSYSQVYTALNAVAGHYNSFGVKYPLPEKRLDRVTKELKFARKALDAGK